MICCKSAGGRITIPHFYDDVQEVSATERELIAQIPFDEEAYKSNLNIKYRVS